MQSLSSYLEGRWVEGTGQASVLVNPSTEEPVAEIRPAGSLAGAVTFARERGGPALRALSFAERGQLLLGLSKLIHQSRDELIDCALRNGGNTRQDAKFDIDGAIGALVHYAELGAKLGSARVLADGEPDQIGRSPRLVGRHLMVPRMGVAVFVNAFNFPAWGFAEKAACALLAGMPVITKPATATALVAHRIFERIAEQQALPEATFQLLLGPVGDLFDHLDGQDVLAFTGSSGDRRQAQGRSAAGRAQRARQPRGRQLERRGARPRRRAVVEHVQDDDRRRRARHDPEDGAEVHRDPARDGAGGPARRRARRAARAAGDAWWSATRRPKR